MTYFQGADDGVDEAMLASQAMSNPAGIDCVSL